MFKPLLVAIAVAVVFHSVSEASAKDLVFSWSDSPSAPLMPTLVYNYAGGTALPGKPILYVTQIPAQLGVPTPVPAPLSFIKEGYETHFKIFVSDDAAITPTTKFKSCELVLKDGAIDPSTTCTGAVITDNSTSTVTVVAFGTPITTADGPPPPPGFLNYLNNPMSQRSITFVNDTGYNAICINFQSKFNTSECSGPGDTKVATSYTRVVPETGEMSAAAFVTGFQETSGGAWTYTGRTEAVGVYATAMEWSMFPTAPVGTPPANTTDHTVGMTNIDVSAVNGYNFAVQLATSTPAICSTATLKGGTAQPAKFAVYSSAMAELPTKAYSLRNLCPSVEMIVHHSSGTSDKLSFAGCMSPCQYATANPTKFPGTTDIVCCSGTYDDSEKCTAATFQWPGITKTITHAELPYVVNLAAPVTKNVYRWQFDDYVGDFSCQPSANFTFTISKP